MLQESFDSFASTTLWGKLIGEWVPEFFLGIVPRVENEIAFFKEVNPAAVLTGWCLSVTISTRAAGRKTNG